MQVLRTIGWVLLAVVLVVFAVYNGKPVEVQVWPTLIWEPPLAALAIFAFLLGLVPMWLVHRTVKWRLKRRVASLEATLASGLAAGAASAPTATTTPGALPADPLAPPLAPAPVSTVLP